MHVEDGAEPHHGGQQVEEAGGEPDHTMKWGGNRVRFPGFLPPGEKSLPGSV
jgi:hypothetical protein